jgi:hypothetical protein
MVAVVEVETEAVVTVNVAEVLPAATVTVAGTVALVELEARDTAAPPVAAGPLRVTVPVEDVPPVTLLGLTATLESVGVLIVSVAVLLTPATVPVIVAVVTAETADVETVKVAVVAPAATVTVAGTVALVVLEVRLTTIPLAPAGPLRVTVPVDLAPPVSDVGLSETPESAAAVIVSVAV